MHSFRGSLIRANFSDIPDLTPYSPFLAISVNCFLAISNITLGKNHDHRPDNRTQIPDPTSILSELGPIVVAPAANALRAWLADHTDKDVCAHQWIFGIEFGECVQNLESSLRHICYALLHQNSAVIVSRSGVLEPRTSPPLGFRKFGVDIAILIG